MTTQNLYLASLSERPSLDNFDVKSRKEDTLFGADFTFHVIGNSHYIESPDLGFYELLSCEQFNAAPVRTLPLERNYEFRVISQTGDVTIETNIRTEPLSKFPDPEAFDVSYRFAEDAYTTIRYPNDDRYETYHTYPEYDLSLYTENFFYNSVEQIPERPNLPTVNDSNDSKSDVQILNAP
jgi:hypothetical protein